VDMRPPKPAICILLLLFHRVTGQRPVNALKRSRRAA